MAPGGWLLVLKIIPDVAFAPTLVEILRSAFVKRGFQLLTLADVTLLHADSGHAPHSSILSVVQLYSCTAVRLYCSCKVHFQSHSYSRTTAVQLYMYSILDV